MGVHFWLAAEAGRTEWDGKVAFLGNDCGDMIQGAMMIVSASNTRVAPVLGLSGKATVAVV